MRLMHYALCLWLLVRPEGRDAAVTCTGGGARVCCVEGVCGAAPTSEWLMRLHLGMLSCALLPLTGMGVG